jgi:hypothetical protein
LKKSKFLSLVFPCVTLLLLKACASADSDSSRLNLPEERALIPKESDTLETKKQDIPSSSIVETVEGLSDGPMALEAKSFDCRRFAEYCDPDEKSNAQRCSLVQNNNLTIAEDQRLTARGESRCFAKAALETKLCEAKVLQNGALIECRPDATSINECSVPLEVCDMSAMQATKCFAKEMGGDETAWTNRPEAWGRNECEARNNLKRKACDKGIPPSDIPTVACEREASPSICPPAQQNCLVQNELIECRIKKIGEIPLREPLKGVGFSACEASYRVKDLACRWQRREIHDLNEVDCRSITRGEAFSG